MVRAQPQPAPTVRTIHLGDVEIGVGVRDVESNDVVRDKLPGMTGAYVTDVDKDSPADKAGIRTGDVILKFAGETVRSARQLERLVEETPDGREVDAVVSRGGSTQTLKVTPTAAASGNSAFTMFGPGGLQGLQNFGDRFTFSMPDFNFNGQPFSALRGIGDQNRGRLGVDVQELTDQLGDFFGTKDGVLITRVEDGTPAKAAGLRAGDVITKLSGRPVLNADDLRRRLTSSSGDVALTIVRDKKEQTVTVKLGEDAAAKKIIK